MKGNAGILCIILLLSVSVWSENTLAQKNRIDSLLKVVQATRQGVGRVTALLSLSQAYRSVDGEKSYSFAKEGYLLAEKLSTDKTLGLAAIVLGEIHLDRSEYADAQNHFETAAQIFEKHRDTLKEAQAFAGLGRAQIEQNHDDVGLQFLVKALELSERIRDYSGAARYAREIGLTHSGRYQFNASLPYLERRMHLEEIRQDTAGLGDASLEYGQSLLSLGRISKAMEYFNKSLGLQEKIRNQDGIARAMLFLGHGCYYQSRLEQSLAYYEKGLRIREQRHEAGEAVLFETSIGNVYNDLDRVHKALEHFQKSLRYHESLKDRNKNMIAYLLGNIGRAYCKMKQWDRAVDHYQRSLQLYDNLESLQGMASTTRQMGELYIAMERPEDALRMYERCLSLFERMGNTREVSRAHSNIGMALRALRRYDESIASFQTAAELDRIREEPTWVACNWNEIGVVFMMTGRIDSAITYCGRSYDLLLRSDPECTRRLVTKNLSDLYERKGDTLRAFHYYKMYSALKDSLLNEANIRTVNEMTAKYESEKQQQQIALLEKDKEIGALELNRRNEALLREQSEAENRTKEIALLQRDTLMKQLLVTKTSAELAMQRANSERQKKSVELLSKEKQLADSNASRDRALRNLLLLGISLLVAVSVLVITRIQEQRKEAAHRAEAAELQARAEKVHALEIAAESERKEIESQKSFTARILASQEEERKRIAGDLHDTLGQELLAIKNQLTLVLKNGPLQEKSMERVGQIAEMASSAMTDVRRISRNLRPLQLERSGLADTLRDMLSQVAESANLHVTAEIADIDGLFSPEMEINVFRIVQEALNNVVKHAVAREVGVRISRDDGRVSLSIIDDGVGIKRLPTDDPAVPYGLGLRGMMERAQMIGGKLEISSAEGAGTKVSVDLPVQTAG